ncbi:MAG: carboxyltransferase domain-containing protein [Polyangiaceae bacterium]|nr:carboxyltransferase domain-containing protein [Polyangiaceae bacterium]
MKIVSYGAAGAYVDLEAEDPAVRARCTLETSSLLRKAFPAADVVSGVGAVAVFGADPVAVRRALDEYTNASTAVPALNQRASAEPSATDMYAKHPSTPSVRPSRLHVIQVVYTGADLDEVAHRTGLSPSGVIDLHTGREHVVEIIGFLPGFAYAGPVHPALFVPRRSAPRPRVEPQSVAIAGEFTGIYPLTSPGGWNLLGTSLGPPPFDPYRAEPFLFAPGDRLQFQRAPDKSAEPNEIDNVTTRDVYTFGVHINEKLRGAPPVRFKPSSTPVFEVTRVRGLASIQDLGRTGLLHAGLCASGAVDPRALIAANRAVSNPPNFAAIEVLLGRLDLVAREDVTVAISGPSATLLRAGETLQIAAPDGVPRYLAIAGGVDVPVVLQSRSTMLSARFGGLEGRPLRAGDLIFAGEIAGAWTMESAAASSDVDDDFVDVDPGPHLDRFAAGVFEQFARTEWRVTSLRDRTGLRLSGNAVPRLGPDLAAPVPMCRGAVQITSDGTPIVLGPDHPTTGGYPVLAVVRAACFSVLARKAPGDRVRFRIGA